MRTIVAVVVTLGMAALAGGCGSDCSGESIFHCPSGASLECIKGEWNCVPEDLSGTAGAPDLSSSAASDLASRGD